MEKTIDYGDEEYLVLLPAIIGKNGIRLVPFLLNGQPMPSSSIPRLPQQVKPKPQEIAQETTPPAYTTSSRTIESYRMEKADNRIGPASDKQKNFVRNLANQQNLTEEDVCSEVGASSIDEMSNSEANEFISKHKDARPRHYDNQSFF